MLTTSIGKHKIQGNSASLSRLRRWGIRPYLPKPLSNMWKPGKLKRKNLKRLRNRWMNLQLLIKSNCFVLTKTWLQLSCLQKITSPRRLHPRPPVLRLSIPKCLWAKKVGLIKTLSWFRGSSSCKMKRQAFLRARKRGRESRRLQKRICLRS